jgi:ribosome-binding factor A
MATRRRIERLNKAIKQEISALLERQVNDPRLESLISVTRVSVSPDLRNAKVFVSILGDGESRSEMLAGFNAAAGFLRRELGPRLHMRSVPQLSFEYDDSIEQGARVLQLIGQIARDEQADM